MALDSWWAETLVQLAGLVEDPNWLVRTLAQTAPWLALWCVQEGRAVDAATRAVIEQRSIRMLRSEQAVERRKAVQTLSEMPGEPLRTRAVEPLLQVAEDDDDPEVAGMAIRFLCGMGEEVRTRLGPIICNRAGQPMAYIPSGTFLMGSDPAVDNQGDIDEQPQHVLELPSYWIGKHPVTVAQFRAFVEAAAPKLQGRPELDKGDDHPVIHVSWHDALAYCRWLSERSGLPVTLPSEAEWEKAARGDDGRLYPWGNEPPTDELCNYNSNRGTTPVGRYSPQGDSPYGCADMAGNVWEWTRSHWKPYPYDAADGREDLSGGDSVRRVLRSGSSYYEAGDVRCASRFWDDPLYRGGGSGFRLVVAPGSCGMERR
ncbi:MAG: SUMF1/EgtB/PvdO family nonheme iron enzyme [Chloroflexi bacterium]|nr:SUMF1/EgtB/PvdO family nonheme iron enzyme [Chloroflexota bacterium]